LRYEILKSGISKSMSLSEKTKVLTVVGTCMDIEKPYFRLGADPDPSKV